MFASITCTSKVIKSQCCTSSEFHHVYYVGLDCVGFVSLYSARLRNLLNVEIGNFSFLSKSILLLLGGVKEAGLGITPEGMWMSHAGLSVIPVCD